MVFSTHAGKKLATEVQARAWRWLWALACLWVGCLSVLAGEPVQVSEQRVVRTEDSVQVFARLSLRLSQPVEEALLKGVPLFFVWQADVVRDRWYWRDKRLTTQYRTWRLAYQPLTRRWRLSLSHQAPGAAQQFSLHQNLASLEQALAAVGLSLPFAIASVNRAPGLGILEWLGAALWAVGGYSTVLAILLAGLAAGFAVFWFITIKR